MSATKSLKPTYAPGKRLLILAILIVALVASLCVGTAINKNENRFTPDLALDLEGGTELILRPITTDGSEITDSDVSQAIEIIRQRVDASGVAEAEITSQGGSNIVVSLPGKPSKETLDLVRTSAVLRLRPVLTVMGPAALSSEDVAAMNNQQVVVEGAEETTAEGTAEAATEGAADQDGASVTSDTANTAEQGAEGADAEAETAEVPQLTPEELEAEAMKQADVDGDGKLSSEPLTDPSDASDTAWITEQVTYDALMLQCGSDDARLAATSDDPKKPFVACDATNTMKYILGPAEIEGTQLTKATSSLAVNDQGTPTGGWAVNMEFNSEGGKVFADVTERIYQLESPRNQFAIVLDGQVLSAPVPNGPIAGGNAQITGTFTSEEAASLANQLSFGSLPLNFTVQSEEQISATLGGDQLAAGLIAGLIGLGLIVIYLLWQYHMLGMISAGSIALSTGLSYLVVCLLSWLMGYRLSMAGVLGLIVSVGITADSFIVYFERIRDEIRDGHTIPGAIEHGWERAKRTIIISDAVNLIASIVLYILTVGSVRGFAFTLGITTVLDLIVVMLFTHPFMVVLMKTKYFSQGGKFSGMEESQLQRTPLYRGRGWGDLKHGGADVKQGSAGEAENTRSLGSSLEAAPVAVLDGDGETLAQRKARERRESKERAKNNADSAGEAPALDADAASEGSDA